jgi:hypothetical protein
VDLSDAQLASPSVPVPLVTDASAAWSPRHGAFVVTAVATDAGSGAALEPALWTIALDGTARAIDGSDGAVGPVGVGSDGSIAVTIRALSNRPAGIGLLAAAASTLTRFDPSGAFDDRWPAFSPDGGTLLIGRTFVVRPDDADGIWSLDLATGVARQLSTDGAFARWLP